MQNSNLQPEVMRLLTGIEAPYTTDALLQAAASTSMDDPKATIRVLDIAHHTIAAERQQAWAARPSSTKSCGPAAHNPLHHEA